MDTTFGVNFADCYEGLSKLLSESDDAAQAPAQVSRAAGSKAGHAGVGPQGIIPGVKIADPLGK